ncbi:MAG TPA: YgeY family selenium metabolism-linked hydrolase [bacterium]|nr:YgeY family selenium metabolism-linked hydrolase [bacterium]
MLDKLAVEINRIAREERDYVADLLQRIIRIPSPSTQEEAVIKLLKQEMESFKPAQVMIDSIGNVVGKFGSGKRVLLYDSHVDTVGVGDPAGWKVDPFLGARRDEVIYGRGASDNKAGIACMVAGLKILTRLAREGDFTLYVVGIVQEEDCEGLALSVLMEGSQIKPECVVLGECTNLAVNRGHRGRAEIEVTTRGRSCHASAPERGENAIHKMTPIIDGIKHLADRLSSDPFLGKGSIAVTSVECATPSLNAVPDLCKIYVDRRVVPSDTRETIAREIDEIARFTGAEVKLSRYARASYKGFTQEREKFFPAWTVAQDSRAVTKAVATYEALFAGRPAISKWVFSTDGNYSMGMRSIPTIGFGPAEERHAHSADDQVRVDDLWKSAAFYALFPFVYSA